MSRNPKCIHCGSSEVVKHGRTQNDLPRFKCKNCNKTWIHEENNLKRHDISGICEEYLAGRTYRDLVELYKLSPYRVNVKIREFLEMCPPWDIFIDKVIGKHYTKVVYLAGRKFASAYANTRDNTMFLALAVDAQSSCVLGYIVSDYDGKDAWQKLLKNLISRGIQPTTFITNGSKLIEESVNELYPESDIKINFHRNYRDRELTCCMTRQALNYKLLGDAVKLFNILEHHNVTNYLSEKDFSFIHDILFLNHEEFFTKLRHRLDNKSNLRIEGLLNKFHERFERFHMLKENPLPIINGWIAYTMLTEIDPGTNRLALYAGIPFRHGFSSFIKNMQPEVQKLGKNDPRMKNFIIEMAIRGLELPIIKHECEIKLEKCLFL